MTRYPRAPHRLRHLRPPVQLGPPPKESIICIDFAALTVWYEHRMRRRAVPRGYPAPCEIGPPLFFIFLVLSFLHDNHDRETGG